MEQSVKRRRRKRQQSQQGLLILIGILAVLLIAVVIVALTMDPGPHVQGPTIPSTPTITTGPIVIQDLTVTAPEQTQFICMEPQVEFQGIADSRETLTINGTNVNIAADGRFSHTVVLTRGNNTVTICYQGKTHIYQVEHRYVVESFTPAGDTDYGCGATIRLSVSARAGSTVSATLNGKTITMTEAVDQMGSGISAGFVLYTGTYKLPNTNSSALDLGCVEFTASCNGITETYSSGTITCAARGEVLASDPSVTPNYGEYIDVGSGYIVEIINNSAETFLSTTGDKSLPILSYLPKGTVDYGSAANISANSQLVQLRCGRQVYLQPVRNYPPAGNKTNVVDCYQGTLPDHNELAVAALQQNYDYTVLVLDTMWKAPFLLDLLPQRYASPGLYEYSISSFTAEYVEITFCYATVFEGTVEIPADNPLFSHAELKQQESDCVLRLYLKKAGHFYGWDAYYNDDDQLCLRFINPKKISKTSSNSYGVDLTGVRILLDVGHGGIDGGAQPTGCDLDEAALNLQLAMKLKAELESMGVTVIMNRTTDISISVQERLRFLKEQAPDLCIALHQNSGDNPSYNGGWVCYYTPFSLNAANHILRETAGTGIYNKTLLNWNKYFVARETVCPVVLMENGFMSNSAEYAKMKDEATQLAKVQAMARGIASYFLATNQ